MSRPKASASYFIAIIGRRLLDQVEPFFRRLK
jgi:hypothetical protein